MKTFKAVNMDEVIIEKIVAENMNEVLLIVASTYPEKFPGCNIVEIETVSTYRDENGRSYPDFFCMAIKSYLDELGITDYRAYQLKAMGRD